MDATTARRSHPRGTAATIGLLWWFVAGVVFYWCTVYTDRGVSTSAEYLAFSSAFPPADGLMALAAALCAEHLRRGLATAVLWGQVTAGALGFIGVVDVTYNLTHDIYRDWSWSLAWEVFVNAFSLTFPVWLARFTWTYRRELGA